MNPLFIAKLPLIWILKKLDLYSLYLIRRKGPLYEDGWFRSFREQASVDASGAPLPWVTYPAIEFIQRRVTREMSVFEYGVGRSTIWWAKRVSEVVSIEHDRAWSERIAHDAPSNVRIYQVDLDYGGSYSKRILEFSNYFDVVVIDGRDRVNCAKNCLQALKPSGVVVLDNSDRSEYSEGVAFLLSNGFRKIEFIGFCPIVNLKSETAIFYRPENSFCI